MVAALVIARNRGQTQDNRGFDKFTLSTVPMKSGILHNKAMF